MSYNFENSSPFWGRLSSAAVPFVGLVGSGLGGGADFDGLGFRLGGSLQDPGRIAVAAVGQMRAHHGGGEIRVAHGDGVPDRPVLTLDHAEIVTLALVRSHRVRLTGTAGYREFAEEVQEAGKVRVLGGARENAVEFEIRRDPVILALGDVLQGSVERLHLLLGPA